MERLLWFERTFQFGYPVGMLPFFLERLEGTRTRIEAKVRGLSEEMLSRQMDGKWSIKQHIGHLAEVDEVALRRLDEMVEGIPVLSPAVFETQQDYNRQPVKEVLQYFVDNRARNIARYRVICESEYTKGSLHPRLKVMMNPVDLAYFDAEHDDHHLVSISEIIRKFRIEVFQ
jgi:uncharacterized damage-inducible protein DinB